MKNYTVLLVAYATVAVLAVLPLLVWLLSKKRGLSAPAQTKYVKRSLWMLALFIYGWFAIPATFYLALNPKLDKFWESMTISLYILPLFYIVPSIKAFNLSNLGLLFLFKIDACEIARGLWFIPKFVGKTILFSTNREEYQFPQDSEGSEKGVPISISTGEHIYTKVNQELNTTKTRTVKGTSIINDEDEDVLSRIMMLIVSPMVVFVFKNATDLFTNFGDTFIAHGEKGVAKEIARQIRDEIVSVATALFPQSTAAEILADLQKVNGEIKTEVLKLVNRWGIELKEAKLTTVNYDPAVQAYLDDLVKKNIEAIEHLIATKKDVVAYKALTLAKLDRAASMKGEHGEKLELILLMESAIAMANGATNVNVGNLSNLGLAGVIEKINGLLTPKA